MSVLMTMRVQGDATKMEGMDPALTQTVIERAKGLGVISHHFYGNSREILVVDEWPDEDSFQKFFESSPEIATMMASAGVTAEPEIKFWHKLDTGDEVG